MKTLSSTRDAACQAALSHLADLKRINSVWTVSPDPEPVYVLQASQFTGSSLPSDLEPSSWQYTADDGSGPNITCEVNNGSANEIISLRYGNAARQRIGVSVAARHRPDVLRGDIDIRILRIPELVVQGLWLMSKSGEADLIVQFGPTFGSYASGDPAPLQKVLQERRAGAVTL